MSVNTGKLDVLTLMSFTGLSEKRKLSRPGIAAPVAQNVRHALSYCPLSVSIADLTLPRQNGKPHLSMKPPAAPAYSKLSRAV